MRRFTADIASGGQSHRFAVILMRIVIINELNVEYFFPAKPYIHEMCGYSFHNIYKGFNIYTQVPVDLVRIFLNRFTP